MRTKRLLLLLLAYAVGGAIINVAVAWGCAIRGPGSYNLFNYDTNPQMIAEVHNGSRRWSCCVMQHSGLAYHRIVTDYSHDDGISFPAPFRAEIPSNIPGWAHHVILDGMGNSNAKLHSSGIEAVGLPCLAMYSVFKGDAVWGAKSITPSIDDAVFGILIDSRGIRTGTFSARVLPVLPLWPGFAINTIFYAAILWLLFAAPGFVRRRIRVRRGQCPACAYPVGSSTVCTECGKPVRV
jgi:hypothetical protein